MSGLELIIDQNQPLKLLSSFIQKRKIPHALLFLGIDGIGKRTAAVAFAMAGNCVAENYNSSDETDIGLGNKEVSGILNPCGACSACRKIKSGIHPDVIHIKPEGSLIKIAAIRNLETILAMKPYEARYRIVIISDAHTMNVEAGNALLKMLEEPPERTIIILTAAQLSDLLPTIISRCRCIRFQPISPLNIKMLLKQKTELNDNELEAITAMAGGSIAKAYSLSQTEERFSKWMNQREWVIKEIESLSSASTGYRMVFAEKMFQKKSKLSDLFDIIILWLRDIIVFNYDKDMIFNKDLIDEIESAAKKNSIKSICSKISVVQKFQKESLSNINLRLGLEVLVNELAVV